MWWNEHALTLLCIWDPPRRVLNSMNVLLVVILIFSCWIFYDLISFFIQSHIQRMEFSENMWGIYIENCRKMERVILCRNLFHSTKLFSHTSLICNLYRLTFIMVTIIKVNLYRVYNNSINALFTFWLLFQVQTVVNKNVSVECHFSRSHF